MVIEIFAGSGHVTACLRQMGLSSAFGTDKVRNKNCVCPLVTIDLTENEDLLWKWLDDPFVVGVFLAPPCGSASRARQIPLGKKGKLTLRRHGPRPLRTGRHPNGIPFLNSSELSRISLSNKLYHLIAKVVRWAVLQVGCIFVVENPQYSLFWATSFWTEVANLCYYSVFHSCQYGGLRKKKTMFAFNAVEFLAISAKCPGQNSRHKHAQWGLSQRSSGFATSEETAYPMGLAKLIAVIFLRLLIQCTVQHAPETLEQVQPYSLQALQKMRATTGTQSRSSRMPPLVRTYKSKFFLKGHKQDLPQVAVLQRLKEPLQFSSEPPQRLPKGARLLAIQHTPSDENGGDVTGGQKFQQ